MGLILKISELCVPWFVKKPQLERLFKATADAFRVSAPSITGLTFEDCLRLYAEFTREQAHRWIRQGRTDDLQARLFENAFQMGKEYRARFDLGNAEEVMRMSRVIYKLLGIDFRGKPDGDVVINRCFFSAYYSGDVCRVVSSLDEGLLAGLSGGGKLRFSRRITEGDCRCEAHLDVAGN